MPMENVPVSQNFRKKVSCRERAVRLKLIWKNRGRGGGKGGKSPWRINDSYLSGGNNFSQRPTLPKDSVKRAQKLA